jgi:hypothetical protein
MPEGFKTDKNLVNLDNSLDNIYWDSEPDKLRLLEAMSEKLKLLENNKAALSIRKEDDCYFKDDCYIAKSKMGSCPCELYR